MRITKLLLVVVAAVATPALAGRKAGVTLPDVVQVGDKQLVLNGMGLREATWLGIDVYVAGLYLERPSSDPRKIVASDQTKQLVLRFVRDVDRDKIVEAWNQGFAGNATVPVARIRSQIDRLNAWMPAFRKGQTLSFTYVPGQGVSVQIDGAQKGVLPGDDFARSLFSIWLGPKPPGQDLKRGLLGSHPEA